MLRPLLCSPTSSVSFCESLGPHRRLLVELVPLVDALEVDRVGEHHQPLGVLGVDLSGKAADACLNG